MRPQRVSHAWKTDIPCLKNGAWMKGSMAKHMTFFGWTEKFRPFFGHNHVQTCQLSLLWREISLFRAKSSSWNSPSRGRFFSLQKLNLPPIKRGRFFGGKYWKTSSLEKNHPLWQPIISYLLSIFCFAKKFGLDFEICLVIIVKFYTNRFNLVNTIIKNVLKPSYTTINLPTSLEMMKILWKKLPPWRKIFL